MPVNLKAPESLFSVAGARIGVAEAAIKKPGRADMALFELAEGSEVAAVFTRNRFAAAPVSIARERMALGGIRGLLVNSGNANAGTGTEGMADAEAVTAALADAAGLPPESILPFSTGVIGQRLPVGRMREAAPALASRLCEEGWLDAARAIMTTDTVPKGASRRLKIGGGEITLTGVAKGAGMIRPDMATMLAFVGTDAAITRSDLESALRAATDASFNRITIDGDTSTNDACVLFATGRGPALDPDAEGWADFLDALCNLLLELAQAIVRDAEGATKFITVRVRGAVDEAEAAQVAFTVAHSPLVKTACFASDPNWGRILAAVGRAGIDDLAIERVGIALDNCAIVDNGEPVPGYDESEAEAVMAQPEFTIGITLGRGDAETTVWTSDLSHEYVRINAEYRT